MCGHAHDHSRAVPTDTDDRVSRDASVAIAGAQWLPADDEAGRRTRTRRSVINAMARAAAPIRRMRSPGTDPDRHRPLRRLVAFCSRPAAPAAGDSFRGAAIAAGRAGARAKAVVPSSGRARLDVGVSDRARQSAPTRPCLCTRVATEPVPCAAASVGVDRGAGSFNAIEGAPSMTPSLAPWPSPSAPASAQPALEFR